MMHNAFNASGGYGGGYVPPHSSLTYYNGYVNDVPQIPYYNKQMGMHPGYASSMGYPQSPGPSGPMYYQQYGLGYQYSGLSKYQLMSGLGAANLGYPNEMASPGIPPHSMGMLQVPSTDVGLTGSMFSKPKYEGNLTQVVGSFGGSPIGSLTSSPPGPHGGLSHHMARSESLGSPPVESVEVTSKDLEKIRRCHICGQAFRLMSECLAHMKAIHEVPGPYGYPTGTSTYAAMSLPHCYSTNSGTAMTTAGPMSSSLGNRSSMSHPLNDSSPLMALERMGWGEKQNVPSFSQGGSSPGFLSSHMDSLSVTSQHTSLQHLSSHNTSVNSSMHSPSLSDHFLTRAQSVNSLPAPRDLGIPRRPESYDAMQNADSYPIINSNFSDPVIGTSKIARKATSSYSVLSIIGDEESVACENTNVECNNEKLPHSPVEEKLENVTDNNKDNFNADYDIENNNFESTQECVSSETDTVSTNYIAGSNVVNQHTHVHTPEQLSRSGSPEINEDHNHLDRSVFQIKEIKIEEVDRLNGDSKSDSVIENSSNFSKGEDSAERVQSNNKDVATERTDQLSEQEPNSEELSGTVVFKQESFEDVNCEQDSESTQTHAQKVHPHICDSSAVPSPNYAYKCPTLIHGENEALSHNYNDNVTKTAYGTQFMSPDNCYASSTPRMYDHELHATPRNNYSPMSGTWMNIGRERPGLSAWPTQRPLMPFGPAYQRFPSGPGQFPQHAVGMLPTNAHLNDPISTAEASTASSHSYSQATLLNSKVSNIKRTLGYKIGPKSRVKRFSFSENDDESKTHIASTKNGIMSTDSSDGEVTADELKLTFAQLRPAKNRCLRGAQRDDVFIGPKRVKQARVIKERQELRIRTMEEQVEQMELEERLMIPLKGCGESDSWLTNVLVQSSLLLSLDGTGDQSTGLDLCSVLGRQSQPRLMSDNIGETGEFVTGESGLLAGGDEGDSIEDSQGSLAVKKPGRRTHGGKVFHNAMSVIVKDTPLGPPVSSKGLNRLRAKDFKWSHYIKSTRFWCNDCGHGFKNQKEVSCHSEEKCKRNCLYMLECYIATSDVQYHPLYGAKVQELLEEYQLDGQHQCCKCGETITRRADFLVHVDSHTDFMPWECTICGNRFRIRGSLKEHLRYTHMKGRVPCLKCNKVFPTSTLLRQHVKVHTQHYKYKTTKNRDEELKTALKATSGALEISEEEEEKLSMEANEYRNWCKLMELNALKNISEECKARGVSAEDEGKEGSDE